MDPTIRRQFLEYLQNEVNNIARDLFDLLEEGGVRFVSENNRIFFGHMVHGHLNLANRAIDIVPLLRRDEGGEPVLAPFVEEPVEEPVEEQQGTRRNQRVEEVMTRRLIRHDTERYLTRLTKCSNIISNMIRGNGPGNQFNDMMRSRNIGQYTTLLINMCFVMNDNTSNTRVLKNIFCMMMRVMYNEFTRRLVLGGLAARRLMIQNGIPGLSFTANLNRGDRVERVHEEVGMAEVMAIELLTIRSYRGSFWTFEEELDLLLQHPLADSLQNLPIPATQWITDNMRAQLTRVTDVEVALTAPNGIYEQNMDMNNFF
ncbi:uncharacterized protein EV154DRAFT_487946 [Mucor mucedo]|uniref:uncharacterized protein n=1 Tax=Mucor mucedo TaxID=29922 RepID=UPI002220297A|nr:uncharacterized protein EV154DRAFT_487946 [Mucor mucedo]KAI7869641.1 hypothetical protein EV154DRAFT_487946 [Mucor mucedo]